MDVTGLLIGETAMKRLMFIVIIGLLGLTACTTFHGVTVISPEVGHPYRPREVDNLQPTLQWKSPSQGDETYDVVIFEVNTNTGSPYMGKMIYHREGIKETYHKVEEPLEPDKGYYWSVRVRQGDKISEWSHYDYHLYILIAYVRGKNLLFYFKTPKK